MAHVLKKDRSKMANNVGTSLLHKYVALNYYLVKYWIATHNSILRPFSHNHEGQENLHISILWSHWTNASSCLPPDLWHFRKNGKKKIHFFRPLLVEFLLFAAKCIPDSVPICAHNTACCEWACYNYCIEIMLFTCITLD